MAAEARENEIANWLSNAIAKRTRMSGNEVDHREPIYRYGIDSLERVNIAYELECFLGFPVDEAQMGELETVRDIARHLAAQERAGDA
jgi:acyl carrier protein